jgi:hypothetical protein
LLKRSLAQSADTRLPDRTLTVISHTAETPRGNDRIPFVVYYSVPVLRIFLVATLSSVVSCSRQPDISVVADTATGNIAMVAVGKLGIENQPSLPRSTAELPKARRIFGVWVPQGLISMTTAQVWLCREQPLDGCINIGGEAETEGRGYRIVFRNFTADPGYENWKSTSPLLLHSHDQAWALDVVAHGSDSEKRSFVIVVGAPGAEGYAVRLAR